METIMTFISCESFLIILRTSKPSRGTILMSSNTRSGFFSSRRLATSVVLPILSIISYFPVDFNIIAQESRMRAWSSMMMVVLLMNVGWMQYIQIAVPLVSFIDLIL